MIALLFFSPPLERANSFSVKQCRFQTTKERFLRFGMGWFVALGFLTNNFMTAFQLKDLDWFLFIIFSLSSPTSYLYFLSAPLTAVNTAFEHNPALSIPMDAR